ncbi:DEAD/DEAH box helicase [Shumkonia mesophila]|uniref:DEAD/DEAH box helicase n=1 Tax=Shumkonia mesophila TaxID=2838854 RepID=UPI00293464C9|nr:DEAD/DEAH box helicase [Shumkonia mesophila]
MELRDYQHLWIGDLRAAFTREHKRVLGLLPTGGGKTICFSEITRLAAARGLRVLILGHRGFLVSQISGALKDACVHHACLARGYPENLSARVQVGTVQTVARRLDRIGHFDLIIIDEAHHAPAGTWALILAAYSNAWVLGVTATPCRLDGKGLGDSFDVLVTGPSVLELTDLRWLVPARIWAPSGTRLDLSGVPITKQGDYNSDALAEVCEKAHLIGDSLEHYTRIAQGAPAIAFCPSLQFAHRTAEQFRSAGYSAAVIEGASKDTDRRAMTADLAAARLNVLISVDVISEGFDVPTVNFGLSLRPTQSLSLYMQQIGRILRISPGKTFAGWIDHAGNVGTHGWPDDDREWSLEKGAVRRTEKAEPITIRRCPECYHVHRPAPACPICRHQYTVQERRLDVRQGTLSEIRREDREAARQKKARAEAVKNARQEAKAATINTSADCRSLEDFHILAKKIGKSAGWAWSQFNNRKRRAA